MVNLYRSAKKDSDRCLNICYGKSRQGQVQCCVSFWIEVHKYLSLSGDLRLAIQGAGTQMMSCVQFSLV